MKALIFSLLALAACAPDPTPAELKTTVLHFVVDQPGPHFADDVTKAAQEWKDVCGVDFTVSTDPRIIYIGKDGVRD